MPRYLGTRYFGPRYFAPRYYGGTVTVGTLEIYDGTVNIRPLGTPNLARGSDNAIELVGLRGELTGAYPADATVTFSLEDSAGNSVSGATNISMPIVQGLTGARTTYRGELPARMSATLALRIVYTLTVKAIDSQSNQREFAVACTVLPG